MIVILEEERDGIFAPSGAVMGDWFVVRKLDGTFRISDGAGVNGLQVGSLDDAYRAITMMRGSLS